MNFVKMHGCGNSFIVTHIAKTSDAAWWRERAEKLCRAHFGVGADGVLLPVLCENGGVLHQPVEVVMINPDGSDMGMCGNGIRCVLRYLFDYGALPRSHSTSVEFLVEGRRITTKSANAGKLVQVGMGRPALISPLQQGNPVFDTVTLSNGEQFTGLRVSMGNPHFVIFDAPKLAATELARMGSALEHHQLFPHRTNIEWVRRESDGSLSVQVWERGAGATLACGTGACATLVAAVLSQRSSPSNTIHMPGGDLQVEWHGGESEVLLTGPTEVVFSGVLSE
jgi:diaminopimelate epimerase